MSDDQFVKDHWLITRIQRWFQQKNQFWLVLTTLCLGAVLALEAISVFASQANPAAWQQSEFLVIPLLGLLVLSIFWRSIIHAVLAFAGAMVTYAGIFLFHTANFVRQLDSPYVADRLGYGIMHTAHVSPNELADLYFAVGIFSLLFCIAITIKPKFFRSKNYDGLPYPV